MLDLGKYSPEVKDAGVVAWPVGHKTLEDIGERAISFTIKAQVLKQIKSEAAEEAQAAPSVKDEL